MKAYLFVIVLVISSSILLSQSEKKVVIQLYEDGIWKKVNDEPATKIIRNSDEYQPVIPTNSHIKLVITSIIFNPNLIFISFQIIFRHFKPIYHSFHFF